MSEDVQRPKAIEEAIDAKEQELESVKEEETCERRRRTWLETGNCNK